MAGSDRNNMMRSNQPLIPRRVSAILAALVTLVLPDASNVTAQTPLDWPTLLHDARLTGRSALKGDIVKPRVIWSHSLGLGRLDTVLRPTPNAPVLLDLNGDGVSERIECADGAKEFTVRNGADGRELWSTQTEQPIYEKLFSVADVNADLSSDLCLVTHYRAEVYDGVTGRRLHKIDWNVGRNYGFNLWGNFDEDPQFECVILSDYTAHVDYLDTGPGGSARHVWSTLYRRNLDENTPINYVKGRRALRFLYRSVGDFDGNGKSEAAFMVYNLRDRRRWRTLVRQLPDGNVIADLENVFLYGIDDADADGRDELFGGRVNSFGVAAFSPLAIWRVHEQTMEKVCELGYGRYCLERDYLAPNASSNAFRFGQRQTILLDDFDADGRREFAVERDGNRDGVADGLEILRLERDGTVTRISTYADPQQRHVLAEIARQDHGVELRGYDVQTGQTLTFEPDGQVRKDSSTRTWKFTSMPVAGDIDGDGRCEIVVQRADGWIQALRATGPGEGPVPLWQLRGWGMNQEAGYARPGRGVVLADLDGDGSAEVLYAGISRQGLATLSVADGRGKPVWQYELPGVSPSWPDCGVDQWSVGRFNDDNVLDVVVQWHDIGHSSAKLTALDGTDGRPLWHVVEVNLQGLARPLQSFNVLVADVNGDGFSDVATMPAVGASVVSGRDGKPLLGLQSQDVGYFSKMSADDVTADGIAELFFNDRQTQAALRVHPQAQVLWSHRSGAPRRYDNPLLVDLDGDGALELCAAAPHGRLTVYDALTGRTDAVYVLPEQTDRDGGGQLTETVACDINGDGVLDLLYGCGNTLYAVSTRPEEGRLPLLWSHELSAPIAAPVVADVDRDGKAELLIASSDSKLHCLDAAP